LPALDELRTRLAPSDELYRRGEIAAAIEALRPIVAESPSHFRPYHNFGFFHFLMGNYQQAAEYTRIATAKMPAYAEGWFVLGRSLAHLGQLEEAEKAFREGLKLQPDNLGAANWLASTLARAGRHDEAAMAIQALASRLGWPSPQRCGLIFAKEPWFLGHIEDWRRLLAPLMGKIEHALEIGCMEGMSTIWTAEHLLSPTGRLLVNDITFRENFVNNVGRAGIASRLDLREGSSQEVLPALPANDFDFAYVDGDHQPDGVFCDAVNALFLVRPGSVIILDDYGKQNEKTAIGLDLFLRLFRRNVEIVEKRYQLVLRRNAEQIILQRRIRDVWHQALTPASAARLDTLARYQPANALQWLRSGEAKLC
jgi:predicted O-methyltransferase YrrM